MTTTHSIRAAVLAFVRQHDLLPPGPLVVAVSGGADSTALLLLLSDLAPELGCDLHVAHFDHRLRARASARDAQFVADLAQSRGATIRIGRADAAPKSEDEARELRYAFLRRAAREVGASRIATGHTRDDQAETVLLHATRGSGLAGLAGMRPLRDDLVRPLLTIGRADTEALCADAKITPREDRSNADPKYARNRIRHAVLPELERINPRARTALARLADAAAQAADAAARAAALALDAATDPDGIDLDRLGPAARDDALAIAWSRATGRTLAAKHRTAFAALAAARAGTATLDLPGGRAVREYARLRIDTGPAGRTEPAGPVPLPTGRTVSWDGWTFIVGSHRTGTFSAPAPAGELVVRSRRPGDRLAGRLRIKVQDLFTDAKVPARARATHPLIATGAGEVWWVVGLKHADGEAAPGRWIVATPPAARIGAIRRYTGNIDSSDRPVADERGHGNELR
ncbi:MAG TPA: tRNA lysidine(34) synthetase TilS [Candidatus Limnocylindria bacterium]|nr:tRNA lysidine(34) synthetase TilS [Candidatus Limnocylindria bacterium]